MHKSVVVLSAVAASLALSAVAALPASAAVVTSDVPAVEFVDLTDETFADGDYVPLVPAGPVVLPAAFAVEDSFAASGISAGAPAAGCSRAVNSATIEFTTEASESAAAFQIVFASGAPADYLPDATFEYEGGGVAVINEYGIVNVTIPTNETVTTSLLTIVPAVSTTDQTVLSILGAFGGSVGAITAASFNVTDTCPDAAAPAVVALPNTGTHDAVPLALAAFGVLLVGGFVLLAARRRAEY